MGGDSEVPEQDPDYLSNPESVCETDVRNTYYKRISAEGERDITLEDHYSVISQLTLKDTVPENIRIQFETTKNIYLYAWFVYRFFPVARLHGLTVLEMALRERFVDELPEEYQGRDKEKPPFRSLLRYSIKYGFLKKEHFSSARRTAEMRARERNIWETIQEMTEKGLGSMPIDEILLIHFFQAGNV